MSRLHFDNRWLRELPADPCTDNVSREIRGATHTCISPSPVAAPRWLAGSASAAALLGLDLARLQGPDWLPALAGNQLLPGMQAWASNYGGHQFGHWAGQLGDGRAISLGEVLGGDGQRWELQLKGAGPTPYSRGADGRAVLRSSIREFIASEAMHHLGIPSTRALSLIGSDDRVWRDPLYNGQAQREPIAVLCRMAPSMVRFGHFELPAARGDTELLRRLVDFVIERDFPALDRRHPDVYADWFAQVCRRTAQMVMGWQRVGFVHGVMNTDNMSILGLSLDYGPFGWLQAYDPEWTPNTTDAQQRRYRYGQQPAIAYWNLTRLAGAIASLFGDSHPLQSGLDAYVDVWRALEKSNRQSKLGLASGQDGDAELWADLLQLMTTCQMDMTLGFRWLSHYDPARSQVTDWANACYQPLTPAGSAQMADWLQRYQHRLADEVRPLQLRHQTMQQVNPCYVPRNYLLQQAITAAEAGDLSGVERMLSVLRQPYQEHSEHHQWAAKRQDRLPPAGQEMLSCSS